MADLPEQVRKQADAVKAHFEQQNTPSEIGTEVTVDDGAQLNVDGNQQQEHVNETVPPVANQEVTTPPAQQQTGTETFEERYRTLQGKYNAEVPRLTQTTKDQAQRLQQLEQLIASMNSQPRETAPLVHETRDTLLSDSEKSEYGDSIDVMRKVSREELGPLFGRFAALEAAVSQLANSLNGQVLPQVQHVATRQAANAEDRFWQDLASAVPNWQAINNDPDFHTWMLDVDPMTGMQRQVLLGDAQKQLDVRRVKVFFDTYAQVSGKFAAQSNRSAGASELEKQVAPGRSRSASAPSQTTARTYTRSDISKFFDEVRQGKYKGREPERNRIEADIFAAQREGRVTAA